jgi:hypothetical protein
MNNLALLRAELHLLNEKEAAALCRALQKQARGDQFGTDEEMREIDQLRLRRGEVQLRIRAILGEVKEP